MTTPEFDTVVVDWRSPVANLYYSGQIGPMSYAAPDGTVTGELTLKRMLTVRDRELLGLFDSGVVSQDAYLQSVLGQVSSDKLREIVTTIQAEQNLVIRHPARQPLIVQGVAGSGKTTIALHRIAWLLYAHRETLRPEQLMILAPNPLFLDYISQVLPDLGVERVVQTTFQGLCQGLLGKQLPKVRAVTRLEDKLQATRRGAGGGGRGAAAEGFPGLQGIHRGLRGPVAGGNAAPDRVDLRQCDSVQPSGAESHFPQAAGALSPQGAHGRNEEVPPPPPENRRR